jgi:hypothetical protein
MTLCVARVERLRFARLRLDLLSRIDEARELFSVHIFLKGTASI